MGCCHFGPTVVPAATATSFGSMPTLRGNSQNSPEEHECSPVARRGDNAQAIAVKSGHSCPSHSRSKRDWHTENVTCYKVATRLLIPEALE
jgi:hypothetical protein